MERGWWIGIFMGVILVFVLFLVGFYSGASSAKKINEFSGSVVGINSITGYDIWDSIFGGGGSGQTSGTSSVAGEPINSLPNFNYRSFVLNGLNVHNSHEGGNIIDLNGLYDFEGNGNDFCTQNDYDSCISVNAHGYFPLNCNSVQIRCVGGSCEIVGVGQMDITVNCMISSNRISVGTRYDSLTGDYCDENPCHDPSCPDYYSSGCGAADCAYPCDPSCPDYDPIACGGYPPGGYGGSPGYPSDPYAAAPPSGYPPNY